MPCRHIGGRGCRIANYYASRVVYYAIKVPIRALRKRQRHYANQKIREHNFFMTVFYERSAWQLSEDGIVGSVKPRSARALSEHAPGPYAESTTSIFPIQSFVTSVVFGLSLCGFLH